MNKYQIFHKLKQETAMKLLTIQDGDRLDGVPDDFAATGTNKDVFDECLEMMKEAKRLADELAKIEEQEK